MKVTVRVEISTETDTFEICQLERPYRNVEPEGIGLSLAEGKDVRHRLQKIVVAAPEEVCMLRRFCTRNLPLRKLIGTLGQRPERRTVEFLERTATATGQQ